MNKLIRIFLGIIFILAAIYRLLFYNNAIQEMINLNLPVFFSWIIISLEIIIGILFLIDKFVKQSAIILVSFLIIGIIVAVISNFQKIILNIGELFVMDNNPTDIFLHIVYVGILIYAILDKKTKS